MSQNADKDDLGWTFFTNHGHVYFLLATASKDMVLREAASKIGITERAVQGIVQDLVEAGYIKREKVGRANKYKIAAGKALRHPLEASVALKDLVSLIHSAKE